MQIRSIGIDLGKTNFYLVALGEQGKVLVCKKFSRRHLLAFTANLPSALIGMEASNERDSEAAEGLCYANSFVQAMETLTS